MSGLFASNKTRKVGSQKDTTVVTLADGYAGDAYYAKVDKDGYLYVYIGNPQPIDVNINGGVDVNDLVYAEDSPHTSGDKGKLVLGIRNDSDIVFTSTDLDYSGLAVDAYGHSKINLYDGYGFPENKITSQSTSLGDRRGLDSWSLKGVPEHFNGNIGTTATTITSAFKTASILIRNTDTTNKILKVSFDSGVNFFDIDKDGILAIEAEIDSFQIKGSAAGTLYQILLTHK